MIPVLIFFAHTIFAAYAFARSYQSEGWLQAFLNLAFIVTLFAVGWTVCDLVVGFFIPAEGFRFMVPSNQVLLFFLKISGSYAQAGREVIFTPKDSVSLIVLTAIEIFFYRFYFSRTKVAKAVS